MSKALEGKVALVTGGGSGIGKATAMTLAREGARVVVADINTERGEATAHLIQTLQGEAIYIPVDVTQSDQVEAMLNQIVAVYGHLDCAHNNAGVAGLADSIPVPTAELTEAAWDYTININLKGVWLCMKYEIQQMLKQGGGSIVNSASIFGLVGFRLMAAYTASKHGVIGLTKTAALEYAQSGIRINAVCPGLTLTPMAEQMGELIYRSRYPNLSEQALEHQPMGRLANPVEIAEAVVWLCSDAASFVTGQTLTIDGGYLAQ